MERHEFEELSAGHALGALSAADELVFREQLTLHPEWAPLARRDEDTVASLSDAIVDVAPPVELRAALLAEIASMPRIAEDPAGDALPALLEAARSTSGPLPTETIQTVARRDWTRGILALAASFVLLAAVGFGSAWLGGHLFPQTAETVALSQIERSADAASATVDVSGGGHATAYWSVSLGQAVLVTDGVATLPDAKTYEMWLVRDGTAVAAGLFQASGGQTSSVLAAGLERGDSIAVTVEPAGGSITGSPSTDPVVVIPTGSV